MGLYDSRGYLFSDIDLRAAMQAQRNEIEAEANKLDANRVLNTAPDDLVQYFVEKNWIEAPTLRRDEWVADPKEAHRNVEDYGRMITVPVTRIEVEIPFDGERDLFRARPSQFTMSPPRAEIKAQSLTLTFEVREGSNQDLRAQVDREVNDIEKYLGWLRSDVLHHNNSLKRFSEDAVRQRRERILSTQGIASSLGIPLRARSDSPKTYAAPTVRKKVVPALPPASSVPYKPEPVLSIELYEHALTVVQNMTEVMERSPSTFAAMCEESLRDNYLVQLNGHFEGQATGETFNGSGKTDILLRIDGKNVFIAECKFWKGAKVYNDTIDQLLGYSSWRDTKTAILVFSKNRDTTNVLSQIKQTTEAHPNYKHTASWEHESGFRYVMHHPGDTNRELTMTVLVFDIPTPSLGPVPAKRPTKRK